MAITGALTVQEVRSVLDSLKDEMRPLVRNKAEVWLGQVVEVIGTTVRVSRGDEPTTAVDLLRPPYPVVGSMPSVGAQVWAASWSGGGIVITGGSSGATGVTSIEGQTGVVDIVGAGGLTVSGSSGTVTLTQSASSGYRYPLIFSFADALSVRTSNPVSIFGSGQTIGKVKAAVETAPTSGTYTIELRKNGTQISGSPISLTSGETSDSLAALSHAVAENDRIQAAITAIGSGAAKLTITVEVIA